MNALKIKYWMIILFILAIIISFANLIFFDWYRVSSNSMTPFIPDNAILLTTKSISLSEHETLFNVLQKNDIVVFRKPNWVKESLMNSGDYYVKRCIGLPGDTVAIKRLDLPNQIVKTIPGQESIMYLFPQDTLFKQWTLTNYGPLWVPKKNNKILLNSYNIRLYKKLILFENPKISIENNKLILNGIILSHYTFKLNYFFMIGDNLLQSMDSRKWGCIPETELLGKVILHF